MALHTEMFETQTKKTNKQLGARNPVVQSKHCIDLVHFDDEVESH
jgi:hypothetical protein